MYLPTKRIALTTGLMAIIAPLLLMVVLQPAEAAPMQPYMGGDDAAAYRNTLPYRTGELMATLERCFGPPERREPAIVVSFGGEGLFDLVTNNVDMVSRCVRQQRDLLGIRAIRYDAQPSIFRTVALAFSSH